MLTTIVLFAAFVFNARGAEWGYEGDHGPEHWDELPGSYCDGTSQSPIDIVLDDTDWRDLGDLVLAGYEVDDDNAGAPTAIENNGHSLVVSLNENYTLSGGGLSGEYKAVQFHFHWGSEEGQGSEHTLDGESYDAEMHIVHYNSGSYHNSTEAAAASDRESLAVLGVLLKIGGDANQAFSKVIGLAESVPFSGNKADISNAFSVADMLPEDRNTYFRYSGSLTTPMCNEIVVWTVFKESVSISEAQLQVLRGLHEGGDDDSANIEDNFRPVQALNDRVVLFNSAPTLVTSSVSLMVIIALNAVQQMLV